MKRPSYEATLTALRVQGTREEKNLRTACEALRTSDDYEATLRSAIAALDRLVADPHLFASSRAVVAGAGADALMASLGYAFAAPTVFAYRGERTPVALRRLTLAARALAAFRDEEAARRASAALRALAPEPEVGAAGTTVLKLLPGAARRRFASDDDFAKALPWVRAVAAVADLSIDGIECAHPARAFVVGDERKTLMALGLWPSATLRLKAGPADAPPPPPPTAFAANKPKPSELIRRARRGFSTA